MTETDVKEKSHLSSEDVDILKREKVYDGFFKMEKIHLRHRLFNGEWSPVIQRERFLRGTAVAAVLYDSTHELIGFVEQFRIGAVNHPIGPWLLEVVAGMTEEGESPEEVIIREIKEEANLTPHKLIPICDYFTSPGGTDESLRLFCALTDLSQAGGIFGLPEEGEDIRVVVRSKEEVFASLYEGAYNNAATLLCLQWLMINHQDLSAQKFE